MIWNFANGTISIIKQEGNSMIDNLKKGKSTP